jgi:hypothetical protein
MAWLRGNGRNGWIEMKRRWTRQQPAAAIAYHLKIMPEKQLEGCFLS